MKAIVNFECEILQNKKTIDFFVDLARMVDKEYYRIEERNYREFPYIYVKMENEEVQIKDYSYIVVRNRKIIGILDEDDKDLFKFIKE